MQSLNTHAVGYAGLAISGASIVATGAALYHLFTDPVYLLALFWAINHGTHHQLVQGDYMTFAQLAAACFALIGGFISGALLGYIGRPNTIPQEKPNA